MAGSQALDPHLQRPLEPFGLRRSRLTCLCGAGRSIGIDIVGAWSARGGNEVAASVFCVGTGSRLAGTTVLLRERPGKPAALWIWLPTSRSVRRLDPGRIDDWVLGSDFVYDDFRIWTPRVLAETSPLPPAGGERAFRGSYAWRGETVVADAVLDVASGLVRAASWSRAGTATPLRRLDARDIETIDGTAAPRELVVWREGGFESRMELLGQVCGDPRDGLPPSAEDLPGAGEVLWATAVDLGLA